MNFIDTHPFTPGERGVCIYPVKYNVVFRPCGKMSTLHEHRDAFPMPYVQARRVGNGYEIIDPLIKAFVLGDDMFRFVALEVVE